MADAKISETTQMLGSEMSAANDRIPIVDRSENQTKYIVPEELLNALALIVPDPLVCGTISIGDGTVSLPSLTNTGDTNTGLFFSAADTIDLVTAGKKALTVDAVGLVTFQPLRSEVSLGSELVANATFTDITTNWTAGAGWSYAGGNAKHAPGNTATLVSDAITLESGSYYKLEVTTANVAASTVTLTLTNATGYTWPVFGSSGLTTAFKASGTSTVITITPNTLFDGDIVSVSVKKITATQAAVSIGSADGSTTALQFRGGGQGLSNLFVGNSSGMQNIGGSTNVGLGYEAMKWNTYGTANIAIGYQAMTNDNHGSFNIGVGYQALTAMVSGHHNVAVGFQAGKSLTTGQYNIAIGDTTMDDLTTANYAIAIGSGALSGVVTGDENIAIGSNAAASVTSGPYNIAIGSAAMFSMTTGDYNIAIGRSAGRYYGAATDANTDPDYCIFIGYESRASSATDDNAIVIGKGAIGIGSNTTVIGADATHLLTQLGGALQLTNTAAAPTNGADKAHLYCADQAAGNACMHTKTENGAVLKLFQGAAVADATGAGDVVTQLNTLLARLRAHGLIAP